MHTSYLMKKSSFLAVLFSISLLSSCTNYISDSPKEKLLEINRFTLDQTNELGLKIFQLTSPKALINDARKDITTADTNILLFDQNAPNYSIQSQQARIENSGKTFSLSGNVRLTKLNDNEFNVFSDRIEWKPEDALIKFFGNVKGNINSTLIDSTSATYDLEKDKLEFQGITRFSVHSSTDLPPIFDINAKSAVWNGDTGVFEFFSQADRVTSKIFVNK